MIWRNFVWWERISRFSTLYNVQQYVLITRNFCRKIVREERRFPQFYDFALLKMFYEINRCNITEGWLHGIFVKKIIKASCPHCTRRFLGKILRILIWFHEKITWKTWINVMLGHKKHALWFHEFSPAKKSWLMMCRCGLWYHVILGF